MKRLYFSITYIQADFLCKLCDMVHCIITVSKGNEQIREGCSQ